jgi:hypothetical protein
MQGDDDDDELGLSLETLRALQQHLQHTMQDVRALTHLYTRTLAYTCVK